MSWDDGKHTKVTKIHLTFDDVINSIEVEYDGTSLKSQPRGTIGTKADGFTLSPDEYITEVNGYYKTIFSGDVITALAFKTNKKTYGPYGNKTRNYFSLNAPNGNQIAGFLGTSGNALNSIDVHFAPIPLAGSTGINPGGTTPAGAGTTPGGAGTTPGGAETTPGGAGTTPGGVGTTPGGAGTTPGDAGTTPGGSGNTPGGAGTTPGGAGTTPGGAGTTPGGTGTTPGGTGTTSGGAGTIPGTTPGGHGNTPGGAGTTPGDAGTTPGATPGGFGTTPGGHGATPGGGAGTTPGEIGTTPGGIESKPGSGSNNDSNTQKLEVQGGKGGNQWDDGANHDGVTKIHIVPGALGIEQIKFDYFKNGETKEGAFHGVRQRGSISTIEINHPNEYLVSVKGWFDSTNIIQGIQFITNTKTSDTFGYGDGEEFSLEVKDKKIIGFHGFADSHLNSLGAYFAPITSTPLIPAKKLKAIGGDEGDLWDDGVFDGVRKVHVGQYHDGVCFVKIEYNKGSQEIEGGGHGKESILGVETFALDYPSEYITALQGYYDNVQGEKGGLKLVTSLIFVTNKQKSYPYGITGGEFFEIKEEGHKIVGFHGKAGDWVHQIGVYVAPITN